MIPSFTVIPEGTFELRQLVRGNQVTTFDVVKDNQRLLKVELSTQWNAESIPKVDLWELTQKLRNSKVIGKESTIVSSYPKHLNFFEGSALTMNFGNASVLKTASELE